MSDKKVRTEKWGGFTREQLRVMRSAILAARGEREGGDVETDLLAELDWLLREEDDARWPGWKR